MVAALRLRISDLFGSGELAVPQSDLVMRYPCDSNFEEWRDVRLESRLFLERWEPRWPADDLTRFGYSRRLKTYSRQRMRGTGKTYFLFDTISGKLLGGLGLTRIDHRERRSAMLGYWMAARFAGRGYMQRAVAAIMDHAFVEMGLEKLEAASVPENSRSIHVLEKSGFRRERYVREFLEINGSKEDHVLFAAKRPPTRCPANF